MNNGFGSRLLGRPGHHGGRREQPCREAGSGALEKPSSIANFIFGIHILRTLPHSRIGCVNRYWHRRGWPRHLEIGKPRLRPEYWQTHYPRQSATMPKRDGSPNRIELLQGTLDLLILQTLQWGGTTWPRYRASDSYQFKRRLTDRAWHLPSSASSRKPRLACL